MSREKYAPQAVNELTQFASRPANAPTPLYQPSGEMRSYHVKIEDLFLECLIGIYEYEQKHPQRIKINLDVEVDCSTSSLPLDGYESVFCYNQLIEKIKTHVGRGHTGLVENLARDIADLCFEDSRVTTVAVEVGKPDAIAMAKSVGARLVFERR